ncbi:Transporter [Rhodovastum atsumiense]|nr:Transporter [Rhodovastum atsumiense]
MLLAGVAMAALTVGEARAGGFALKEQSAMYQGAAFAGAAARADDPATLFFNSAGMTRLPGYQVSVSSSLIMPQSTLQNANATTVSGFPVLGTLGGDIAGDALLPSIFATAEIGGGWWAGLAITSPFGLTTKYGTDSIARYYALTSQLRTYNITPSVAYQVLPNLSVSAGLQIEVVNATLSNSVDLGSVGASRRIPGYFPGRNDALARLKGDDTAVGWQVGLLYEPIEGTRVGVNYRSSIYHQLGGSVGFENVQYPLSLQPNFRGGPATAKLATPGLLGIGFSHDIGPVTLLAQLDYSFWSSFRTLYIDYPGGPSITDENWRDTYTLSLGADWRLNDKLTLRGGVAYDQTPVRNIDRTPRIPDGDRYWLSVGATYKPLPKLAISAAYTHIFVDNTHIGLVDGGPGTPNYLRGNFSASYNNQIDIVSVQGTYAF